jgi:hypothetical protein
MKKIVLGFLLMLISVSAIADSLILNNQVSKPINNKKYKTVIQWASSAKDVEENNIQLKKGEPLNPHSLQVISGVGKFNIKIPKKAGYFRILVWTKSSRNPAFLTNWVDVVPKKTYTLNKDILIPFVFISGMGC